MKKIIRPVFIALMGLLVITLPGSANPEYILPFRSGTNAIYGSKGIHDCGFSTGWKAVDILPAENMVYASQSGTIANICRDGTQVSFQLGNNFYAHLVDTGQKNGDHYNQGDQLGGMVTGSFNATCGYADQTANTFHVHYCFIPDGNSFSADGYVLDTNNGNWTKNGQVIKIGGTLTASWGDGVVPGTNNGLFNVFNYLLAGLTGVMGWILNTFFFPPGTTTGQIFNLVKWADSFIQGAFLVLSLTYAGLSIFNWIIPLGCFAVDMVLYVIQLAVTIWGFVTSLLKNLPFL